MWLLSFLHDWSAAQIQRSAHPYDPLGWRSSPRHGGALFSIDVSLGVNRRRRLIDGGDVGGSRVKKPLNIPHHQMDAWVLFVHAHARVMNRLADDLDEAGEVPLGTYDVLVQLSL